MVNINIQKSEYFGQGENYNVPFFLNTIFIYKLRDLNFKYLKQIKLKSILFFWGFSFRGFFY